MVPGSAPTGASLWNAGTSVADCGSASEDRWLALEIDCCGSSSKPNAQANKINRAEHFWIKGIKISPFTPHTFRNGVVNYRSIYLLYGVRDQNSSAGYKRPCRLRHGGFSYLYLDVCSSGPIRAGTHSRWVKGPPVMFDVSRSQSGCGRSADSWAGFGRSVNANCVTRRSAAAS
jgi:hypothetical protein